MKHHDSRDGSFPLAVLVAYLVTLVLYLGAAFFPQYRIWGFNWWGYLPVVFPAIFLLVTVALGFVCALLLRHDSRLVAGSEPEEENERRFWLISALIIVLFGLAFYFLRARTHFLGDGYTALSVMVSDQPIVKFRNLGETLIRMWLRSLLGIEGQAGALASYQAVSIAAGVLFLGGVGLLSRFLFARTAERLFFLLGLASGGYMLLFFGYVEHYSLFVPSVALFVLVGLGVIRGAINRWYVLPMLLLSVFFHIFGITLIPAAVYLFLYNTRAGWKLARLQSGSKALLALILILIAAVVYYYAYSNSYFLRFAVLPVFSDRFTIDGYTMFSSAHLLDLVNLFFMLLPALLILVVLMLLVRKRKLFEKSDYKFLLIVLLSTTAAVFVFDPKLGMPRDWDLFSFAGVAPSILLYYILLDNRHALPYRRTACLLAVILGFAVLGPRVVSQVIPDMSLAHFQSYLDLDRTKSKFGRTILIDYYLRQGDQVAAGIETRRAEQVHPEYELNRIANSLYYQGKLRESIMYARRAIAINPMSWDAYANIGGSYIKLGMNDSALQALKIASGLNPYNAVIEANLGTAYVRTGDDEKGRRHMLHSVNLDSTYYQPLVSLSTLYLRQNQIDESRECLLRLGHYPDVPYDLFRSMGNNYVKMGHYAEAARAYEFALQRGMDSAWLIEQRAKYPRLGR